MTASKVAIDQDGAGWSSSPLMAYEQWHPFLKSFDRVTLLARESGAGPSDGMRKVTGQGVQILTYPDYKGAIGFILSHRKISRIVKRFLSDPQLFCGLWIPNPLSRTTLRRVKLARGSILSIVVGDASSAGRTSFRGLQGRLIGFVSRRNSQKIVRCSDAVVYVTREYLQRLYPTRAGTLVLSRSNVRFGAKFPEPRSTPPRLGESGPIRLIAVGSQEQWYKGHRELIEAVSMLRDQAVKVELLLVGNGRYHEELVKRASELRLDNILFLKRVGDSADVSRVVREADIFVMPSHTEGAPKALLEAMAVGAFCIGSNVGGIPELLPKECLFRPKSPESIAECLRFFLSNREDLVRAWAQQQREIEVVKAKFSGDELLAGFVSKWVDSVNDNRQRVGSGSRNLRNNRPPIRHDLS